MGKIRGNNPLFTTKLHFVENFIRMRVYKGYNVGCKCIDFIDIMTQKMIVGESGRKCGLWKSRWEMEGMLSITKGNENSTKGDENCITGY